MQKKGFEVRETAVWTVERERKKCTWLILKWMLAELFFAIAARVKRCENGNESRSKQR